jgi:hypothetical protein
LGGPRAGRASELTLGKRKGMGSRKRRLIGCVRDELEKSGGGAVREREVGESSQSQLAPSSLSSSSSSSARVRDRGRITKPSRRGGRAGGRSRGGSRTAGISRLATSHTTTTSTPNIDFDMHIGVRDFTQHEEYIHQEEALQLQGLQQSDVSVPADVSQMHIHNEQDLDLELDPTAASIVGSLFRPYDSGR